MSILVIRPGALGDTILTLPILDAITRKHPGEKMVLLGAKQYAFLIPPNVSVDRIDSVKWSWVFENTSSHAPSFHGIDMAYVILKNHLSAVKNLEAAGVKTIHASSQPEPATSIVETLCKRLSLPAPPRQPYLKDMSCMKNKKNIWIAPGSGSRKKNAPLSLFTETCNMIKIREIFDFHITLGESDNWLLTERAFLEFLNGLKAKPLHDKSLHNIITTCCNSRLFIGNDSGASHLAAALNIPCILFFQTTDFRVWAPWVPEKNLFIHQSKNYQMADKELLSHFLSEWGIGLSPV